MIRNLLKLTSRKNHTTNKTLRATYSTKELEAASAQFDQEYYLKEYPDVANSGIDPFTHYMLHGRKENRNPSPNIQALKIKENSPNSSHDGICVAVHHPLANGDLSLGSGNTSAPSPFPSSDKNTIYTILTLLGHLGITSRLNNPTTQYLLDTFLTPLFSPHDYRSRHSLQVGVSDATCLTRYLSNELECGISPSPLFDSDYYLSQIPQHRGRSNSNDVNAVLNWLEYGVKEHISPNKLYSDKNYLKLNPDLNGYPNWPFQHFIQHGIIEGRQFLPTAHLCTTPIFHVDSRYRSTTEYALHVYKSENSERSPLADAEEFFESIDFERHFEEINKLEPEIGSPRHYTFHATAPLHDASFFEFRSIIDLFPNAEKIDTIIFVPFCKLGGADYVAGVLAHAEQRSGKRVIVIRTDQSDWERPDWFPSSISTVDLSRHLSALPETTITRILYEIVRLLGADNVFNVNSFRFFRTIERFGKQLAHFTKVHCYYFCADRDQFGCEAGYPITYFTSIFAHIATVITDNKSLAETLISRYRIPPAHQQKIITAYTPTSIPPIPHFPAHATRHLSQPTRVFWGGRLDRQKRFDLVIEIAKRMPRIRFDCWGKSVLDENLSFSEIPANITIHPPFKSLEDLPLSEATVWLYTSEWDGLPTILLECAARALPLVASVVGGVGELVDASTGWPVTDWENPQAYVDAICEAAGSPVDRDARLTTMRKRLEDFHSQSIYQKTISEITGRNND